MAFYIDAEKEDSPSQIAWLLKKFILHHRKPWSELVFLCIGTDRVTGDCLGPYVGKELNRIKDKNFFVYGTPEQPVHALNLKQVYGHIKAAHPNALVIAIDASLGEKKHLGYVTIGNGALYPGAGVKKELPPVGDIHITGVVNTGGFPEQLTLLTTRLSTVVSLANAISQGIIQMLSPVYRCPRRQDRISQEEQELDRTHRIRR